MSLLSLDTTAPHDYEPGPISDDASLTELADHFQSDKGSLKHHYTKIYERVFASLKDKPVNFLEIGVACGASLKMWSRFFPNGTIAGVDIRPECKDLCKSYPNIKIAIADATKTLIEFRDGWDVIIDDGSHLPGHIFKTFRLYWEALKPGGIYCIEDLKCTHAEGYSVPFETEPKDHDRGIFLAFMDGLMRNCDVVGGIESMEYHRELLIIRKANG